MDMMIHQNTVEGHKSSSGKAIYLTVRFGLTSAYDKIEWFPLSQITVGEPNECGWSKITIPDWLIRNKSLQKASFVELEIE